MSSPAEGPGCPMRPVLELHLTGQSTPDIQLALSQHLPTCGECLATLQSYAEQPPAQTAEAAYLSEQELAAEIARLEAESAATARAQARQTDPRAATAAPLPAQLPDDDGPTPIPRPVRALFELVVYGGLAAVVGILVILVPDLLAPPETATEGRVASGVRVAEVRMTRLRPDGALELMTGNVIAPKDRISFTYVNTSDWERLLIVVTDENNEFYWQFPEWTDRREPAYAPTILRDRRIQNVPAATHREWEGKLLAVRSIFSKDFITTRQVEERLLDPERDPAQPLFPNTVERVVMVAVDPDATEVRGLPQEETDDSGAIPRDNYLRIDTSP